MKLNKILFTLVLSCLLTTQITFAEEEKTPILPWKWSPVVKKGVYYLRVRSTPDNIFLNFSIREGWKDSKCKLKIKALNLVAPLKKGETGRIEITATSDKEYQDCHGEVTLEKGGVLPKIRPGKYRIIINRQVLKTNRHTRFKVEPQQRNISTDNGDFILAVEGSEMGDG